MAIKAPKPDAPPVTRADLLFNREKSKGFDRSATGVMMALDGKGWTVDGMESAYEYRYFTFKVR